MLNDRSMGLNPSVIDGAQPQVIAKLASDISNLLAAKEPRAKLIEVRAAAADAGGDSAYEMVIDVV